MLDKMVAEGRWADAKKAQPWMGSINGQTIGIVGCGAIGRMMARKSQAFGMKVLGFDPFIAHPYLAKENGIKLTSFEEVMGCDYVSLHPDLNETSLHMINDKAFGMMKPHAYLINTSRGKVVEEPALVRALEAKKIAGAGLDVFEAEPLPKDSPLTKMDNVIMLPHSASYSTPAFDLAPINIAQEVARVLTGKMPRNVVNPSITPRVKLTK
jgi:D-3-phosphoglycerate dehydrogenase